MIINTLVNKVSDKKICDEAATKIQYWWTKNKGKDDKGKDDEDDEGDDDDHDDPDDDDSDSQVFLLSVLV